MKSIHVLRKPCAESTVAANVLRWGTGALNIGATRIKHVLVAGGSLDLNPHLRQGIKRGQSLNPTAFALGDNATGSVDPAGRWPANLILQHLDGCVQDGVKKVGSGNVKVSGTRTLRENPVYGVPNTTRNAPDNYGTETVTAWVCVEGCPVASLPFTVTNPGTLQSDASNGRHISIAPIRRHGTGLSSGNSGGASRFFKQVKP